MALTTQWPTAHANDNDRDGEGEGEGEGEGAVVVDTAGGAAAGQPPMVTIPARRPDNTYASRGNLILPLRFARRMSGWSTK